jgi:hypothetical protein
MYADFQRDFLQNTIVAIFCPKLDADLDEYIGKLTDILSHHTIHSITILHMEVSCFCEITYIINQALERSGTAAYQECWTNLELFLEELPVG